jgi:hypothetical protein
VSRPTEVDLTVPHERWREIPMPAATRPLTMVRLDSDPDVLALYCRFPPGFERPVAGGYVVSEEFVVLDGELLLDGTVHRRGDLVHVPAHRVRSGMRSDAGCTVIAWFDGMADFLPAAELPHTTDEPTSVTSVRDAEPGIVLETTTSRWVVAGGDGVGPGADDLVDLDLRRWRRGGPCIDPGHGSLLVRTRG